VSDRQGTDIPPMHMDSAAGHGLWWDHLVGTSGVEADGWTIEQAVKVGGPGGRLILHPEQAAQLGDDVPDGVTLVVSDEVECGNCGEDWFGGYFGPAGVVAICSRRRAPGCCPRGRCPRGDC
jgi:hypothetical protein